jgi:hypothetical protein
MDDIQTVIWDSHSIVALRPKSSGILGSVHYYVVSDVSKDRRTAWPKRWRQYDHLYVTIYQSTWSKIAAILSLCFTGVCEEVSYSYYSGIESDVFRMRVRSCVARRNTVKMYGQSIVLRHCVIIFIITVFSVYVMFSSQTNAVNFNEGLWVRGSNFWSCSLVTQT